MFGEGENKKRIKKGVTWSNLPDAIWNKWYKENKKIMRDFLFLWKRRVKGQLLMAVPSS